MGSGLRYTPSSAFETFPFPQNLSSELESKLEKIGEEYHEFRRLLMLKLQLGLTKTYNQFHNRDLRELTEEDFTNIKALQTNAIEKQYGKETFYLYNHLMIDVTLYEKNVMKNVYLLYQPPTIRNPSMLPYQH